MISSQTQFNGLNLEYNRAMLIFLNINVHHEWPLQIGFQLSYAMNITTSGCGKVQIRNNSYPYQHDFVNLLYSYLNM